MTTANIMPLAVNETVHDFKDEALGHDDSNDRKPSLTPIEVQQQVDNLYTNHDSQMLKLLSKIAIGE